MAYQDGDMIFQSKIQMDSSMSVSEDIWDDEILINKYDKALKIAKEQVAKRLAMKTNTVPGDTTGNSVGQFKVPHNSKHKNKKKAKSQQGEAPAPRQPWAEGAPCRAVYSVDNLTYEATILHILDDNNCIVSYIGYENEEVVPLSALESSLGEGERHRQMQEADKEAVLLAQPPQASDEDTAGGGGSQGVPSLKKSKKKKAKSPFPGHNGQFQLPPLGSFNFPPFASEMDFQLPPPPPMPQLPPSCGGDPLEEQALASMLLSWYMSGYYTGLYQGKRMATRSSQQKNSRYSYT